MKRIKQVNLMIMVIGSLSILSGAYLAFKGQPFQEYYFSILIGISQGKRIKFITLTSVLNTDYSKRP